jgi:hypothetical protein
MKTETVIADLDGARSFLRSFRPEAWFLPLETNQREEMGTQKRTRSLSYGRFIESRRTVHELLLFVHVAAARAGV